MKLKLTKEELENDLLYETLEVLQKIFNDIGEDLYVVGATARDIMLKLLAESPAKRKTLDLDVAIVLGDWNQYADLSSRLCANNFKKLMAKQKFVYKGPDNSNDYEVDVVPFGRLAQNESINWPPDGTPEMSVRCYDDVMSHALEVDIEGIAVKIAPLAGQFLIKLDTWIDRNDRENKDAADMLLILEKFYMASVMDSDGLPPDEVNVEEFDDYYITPGAEWIASDLAQILSDDHLKYYIDTLEHEISENEESRLLRHLTLGKEDDPVFWEIVRNALKRMTEIWNKELTKRSEPER